MQKDIHDEQMNRFLEYTQKEAEKSRSPQRVRYHSKPRVDTNLTQAPKVSEDV